MYLFLMVYWWLAALYSKSRFAGFNSRLDRSKFPFRVATGIRWQDFDFALLFCSKTVLFGQNRANSRLNGKNREARISCRTRRTCRAPHLTPTLSPQGAERGKSKGTRYSAAALT